MKKTNIVFIFIDDLGCADLGYCKSTFYDTPNIDYYSSQGIRFQQAYAACPVCSPSRASFLTGQYPARVGITDWIDQAGDMHPLSGKLIDAPYKKHLPEDIVTVAEALRNVGYQTWHVGKWHLGEENYGPTHLGFDVNIGGCYWGHPREGYFSPYNMPNLPDGPQGEYLTDRLTDEAINLLAHADADKPFFLNFCPYAVHTPLQAKPEDIQRYKEKAHAMKLDKINPFIKGEYFPTHDKKNWHVNRRVIQSDPVYAAMIWNLDENIGRLMRALETYNLAQNTLVVFTSDNGGLSTSEGSPTCNFPAIEGKGWMYEGGNRVPAFAYWPGHISAGTQSTYPITTPDYFPTFLQLAEAIQPQNQPCDGVSLLPLLQGEAMTQRPIFWHYPHYGNQGGTPSGAVLYGKYKLIEFYEDNSIALFDLQSDASETKNLAKELPEISKHLQELLHEWRNNVGAVMPEENKKYKVTGKRKFFFMRSHDKG